MAILGNPSGVTPPAQSQVYVAATQAGPITFGVANGSLVTVVPLAFHLQNPLLGPNCYVGMVGNPVTLNLTTGTSGTLTGATGQLVGGNGGNTIQTIGTEVVDGLFSVPGASGCGNGGVWDSAIDSVNGLPSPSGSNVAILYGTFDLGAAPWVERNLHE